MGVQYNEIKIHFENTEDCEVLFEYLQMITESRKTRNEKLKLILQPILQVDSLSELTSSMNKEWFSTEEPHIHINKLKKLGQELIFEFYGANEVNELAELIRYIVLKLKTFSYREIESTTKADGVNFIWKNEDKLMAFHDFQRSMKNKINLEDGFEASFSKLQIMLENKEIKPSIETRYSRYFPDDYREPRKPVRKKQLNRSIRSILKK